MRTAEPDHGQPNMHSKSTPRQVARQALVEACAAVWSRGHGRGQSQAAAVKPAGMRADLHLDRQI